MIQAICVSCEKPFIKNPRLKKQKYCSSPTCQRARKTRWQREKVNSDPDYKAEQYQATKDWYLKNPDYWKNYRKKHPQKTLRNKLLQKKRNQLKHFKNRKPTPGITPQKQIAKMDALKASKHNTFTECWVVPVIAKMDVLKGYLSVNIGNINPKKQVFQDCKDGRYG